LDNPNTVVVIRTIEELKALRTMRGTLSEFTLVLEMPGLTAEAARSAGSRIASYRNECGCSFEARCMTAGFLLALVYLVARFGLFTSGCAFRLPLAFACALVCAGAGKAIGIRRARTRLGQEIDSLAAQNQVFPKEI
jgi:hypothetical protein